MIYSLLSPLGRRLLKWFLRRKVTEFERANHYDMGYARAMLEANPLSLVTLYRAGEMGNYPGPWSKDAQAGVKLVAALHEDCGPCLQLGVTLAQHAGVPESIILPVISGDPTGDEETDLAVNFARAVLSKGPREDELRNAILARFGQDGLTAIAFWLTGTRLYPMLKTVLGYAQCYPAVLVGRHSVRLHATHPLPSAPIPSLS